MSRFELSAKQQVAALQTAESLKEFRENISDIEACDASWPAGSLARFAESIEP